MNFWYADCGHHFSFIHKYLPWGYSVLLKILGILFSTFDGLSVKISASCTTWVALFLW